MKISIGEFNAYKDAQNFMQNVDYFDHRMWNLDSERFIEINQPQIILILTMPPR